MPMRPRQHKPRTANVPRREGRASSCKRGYGRRWRRLRLLYLAENPLCVVCGEAASQADHVLAREKGGTDDWENLQSLCHRHHSEKTAREDGAFGRRRPC